MSGSRPFPLWSSLEPPLLPPLPPIRRAGVSVPYPWSPAARSRDALLLLWVLIMETKRVEIPGSVLDDLCRYRGAVPAPFVPSSFSLTLADHGGLRVSPPPPSLSSLSGPAAARFPCSTLLSRTILPLSLRRSLRVSRGPSVLLRGAPEFPHFLSSPTLVFLQVMPLRQSQGLERFCFFFRLPPPPPIVFFFFSASDFFIDRFPPPPSVSGLSSVPDPRVLSLSSPTPLDLSREAFSNLTFRRCVLTRPWHFLNCYKELLSCSFPNLSLEGGWGIDSCSFFPLFFNFPYRKFSTAGL